MRELERLEGATNKVTDFQKQYNENSKNIAYFLGKNLTLIVCMLVPLLLVGFVWTDFGDMIFQTHMIMDGIVTIALFAIGEIMMVRLGSDGGKLDEEYISAKGEFDQIVKDISDIGTRFMGVFCDWTIDNELDQATRFRAKQLKFTPKMWDEIKDLSHEDLVKKYGETKAKKIQDIIDLEPIELNEAILLYDGEVLSRGSLPESGEESLHKKSQMIVSAVSLVFTGLLTVSVAITLTSDITFARVIYTAYKLTMLLFRMAKGYERGAKAYNTTEVKRLKAKVVYLRQYIKFINDKTYMELVGEYEELAYLLKKDEPPEQLTFDEQKV